MIFNNNCVWRYSNNTVLQKEAFLSRNNRWCWFSKKECNLKCTRVCYHYLLWSWNTSSAKNSFEMLPTCAVSSLKEIIWTSSSIGSVFPKLIVLVMFGELYHWTTWDKLHIVVSKGFRIYLIAIITWKG